MKSSLNSNKGISKAYWIPSKLQIDHFSESTSLLASSQALSTLYRIENKKGESLVHLDHMLDMVGRGLDHTLQD